MIYQVDSAIQSLNNRGLVVGVSYYAPLLLNIIIINFIMIITLVIILYSTKYCVSDWSMTKLMHKKLNGLQKEIRKLLGNHSNGVTILWRNITTTLKIYELARVVHVLWSLGMF